MLRTLQSIWVWFAVASLVLIALPTLAIVRLFDRDPAHYRTGRVFRWIGSLATRVNPTWEIELEGEPPENPRNPYVVVCNHQSLADIPIICRLPGEMKWVIKIELFRVPLFGQLLRLSGDIPVDRKDKKSRSRVLKLARDYLRKRCSVMLFPEGTRSRDGRVLRFTSGAFRMAIQEQVPVLPLAIDGTQDALPKHSWKLSNDVSHMRLKVFPPVETEELTLDDVSELRERVRDTIVEQLAEWRGGAPRAEVDAQVRRPDAEKVKDPVNPPAQGS